MKWLLNFLAVLALGVAVPFPGLAQQYHECPYNAACEVSFRLYDFAIPNVVETTTTITMADADLIWYCDDGTPTSDTTSIVAGDVTETSPDKFKVAIAAGDLLCKYAVLSIDDDAGDVWFPWDIYITTVGNASAGKPGIPTAAPGANGGVATSDGANLVQQVDTFGLASIHSGVMAADSIGSDELSTAAVQEILEGFGLVFSELTVVSQTNLELDSNVAGALNSYNSGWVAVIRDDSDNNVGACTRDVTAFEVTGTPSITIVACDITVDNADELVLVPIAEGGGGGDATAANQVELLARIGDEPDAAATGDPGTTPVIPLVKQLVNVLVGSDGIATWPAAADPANGVSIAEAVRANNDDVTGLNGAAMRGTDSAALALNVPDLLSLANIEQQSVDAQVQHRLNELFVLALASQPTAGSLFGDLTEDDGGTQRFTTNALEQAPSGGGTAAFQTGVFQTFAHTTLVLQLASGQIVNDNDLKNYTLEIFDGDCKQQGIRIDSSLATNDTVTVAEAFLENGACNVDADADLANYRIHPPSGPGQTLVAANAVACQVTGTVDAGPPRSSTQIIDAGIAGVTNGFIDRWINFTSGATVNGLSSRITGFTTGGTFTFRPLRGAVTPDTGAEFCITGG